MHEEKIIAETLKGANVISYNNDVLKNHVIDDNSLILIFRFDKDESLRYIYNFILSPNIFVDESGDMLSISYFSANGQEDYKHITFSVEYDISLLEVD